MYQLLLIPVAFGLAKLFSDVLDANRELAKIDKKHIYRNYLIKYFKKDDEKIVKQKITKSINLIVENYSHFKIGKSGIPAKRAEQHEEYTEMFLLCESKYSELIENLEKYYNKKFRHHEKNDNKNYGSASTMSKIDDNYYLYVVVI